MKDEIMLALYREGYEYQLIEEERFDFFTIAVYAESRMDGQYIDNIINHYSDSFELIDEFDDRLQNDRYVFEYYIELY